MANLDIKNRAGVVDKRMGRGTSASVMTEDANLKDVNSMRARLTALNGTLYTSNMLDKMTHNDMEYAIRVLGGDSSGI